MQLDQKLRFVAANATEAIDAPHDLQLVALEEGAAAGRDTGDAGDARGPTRSDARKIDDAEGGGGRLRMLRRPEEAGWHTDRCSGLAFGVVARVPIVVRGVLVCGDLGATRILATNALHVLPQCDQISVVENGALLRSLARFHPCHCCPR